MRRQALLSIPLLALPLACGGPDSSAEPWSSSNRIELSAEDLSPIDEGGQLLLRLDELPAAGVSFDTTKGPIDYSKIVVVDGSESPPTLEAWLDQFEKDTGVDLAAARYFGITPDDLAAPGGESLEVEALERNVGLPNAVGSLGLGWANCGYTPTCLTYGNWFRSLVACQCPNVTRDPIQEYGRVRRAGFGLDPSILPALPGTDITDPEPPEGSDPANGGGTGGTDSGGSGSGSSGESSSGGGGSGSSGSSGGSHSAGGSTGGGYAGGF